MGNIIKFIVTMYHHYAYNCTILESMLMSTVYARHYARQYRLSHDMQCHMIGSHWFVAHDYT